MRRAAIRKQLWAQKAFAELVRDVGEFARDVQKAFDGVPDAEVRTFTDFYREPMPPLGGLPQEPVEIRAGRVLLDGNPETVVSPGHVHFTYLGATKGARINAIAGLTVDTRYRFTLVVTYA